ncbi:hypothetical protein B0I35DRAFT_429523 [Stachybotrys elegans]|uniref:RING-CH-type domain-containing protein n=1 Tax=Stachybotrys elegans TaxID=80388 RepID=A0A8K0WSU4_9HYPO|nr:hypothetical protein B0I35DRAFT_429523 [Stachybotrys elegans]
MDTQPTWDWSAATADDAAARPADSATNQANPSPGDAGASQGTSSSSSSSRRHYGPRTCRICLETVYPTFPDTTASTLGIPVSSRPTYLSEDPDLGRLLSPCKCKGSQKYVHEGCLQAWRLANPTATRNYWSCPTCKFSYRMARLQYAAVLRSVWLRSLISLAVLVICTFAFGFIADPILDLWFDPVGTLSDTVTSVITDIEAMNPPKYQYSSTWGEHFLKGFFSLGLVGLFKSMLAMGPLHWFNVRIGLGSGRRGTGRARVDNINLAYVLIGAFTFLVGIWKVVNAVITRILKRVSDRVVDIGGDDDGEFEEAAAQEERKNQ